MLSVPKSSAEILAAAKKAPQKLAPQKQIRPRKLKTDLAERFKKNLSRLSANLSLGTTHEGPARSLLDQGGRASDDAIRNINFIDPVTPETLDAALEIKEMAGIEMESLEDLFDDEPMDKWASETIEPESQVDTISSSQTRKSLSECLQDVLALLRYHRLSPFDLVLEILDENKPQYSSYRAEFYKEGNDKLSRILDSIISIDSGKRKLRMWIQQVPVVTLFSDVVTEEMNSIQKAELLPGIAAITPEFIQHWTLSPHQETAPCISRILLAAAQTSTAKEKNKKKNPDMLCNVLLKQLSYQRSTHSLGFPSIFGLFLWATGSARQTIDVLHRCSLSLAIDVGSGIHVFCYDNVNLSTSIFVEQCGASSPAKVTSGTFAVLYRVRNGKPEYMKLAPITKRFKEVKIGLRFKHDIRPSHIQQESFLFQLKVVVVRVLTKYVKGFTSRSKVQSLQSKPRRPIPQGYLTEQFPLRATTIEEATVRGNLQFHDDIYTTQLKRPIDGLSEYAIPSINDQLTNARIRSVQILRARDINAWERREVFQLGFGLFHLCLNLVWALLHVHRGSLVDSGSLAYFFALLEKTRLGNDHPDYHTLLAALTQIFDGLILNAWRTQCGQKPLAEFAASDPPVEDLMNMAEAIIREYATPLEERPRKNNTEADDSADEENVPRHTQTRRKRLVPPCVAIDNGPDPDKDRVYQNIRLLTRDLLYLLELIRAISDGDIGRIEDFLPQLAMMFRGAGSNNYCSKILHFILNLKYVWTPEFADIMRDNMLVNISGLEGHSMAIDINMEHLIGQLKDLLNAKGLESTWDRLGDISAAIVDLYKIKKKVSLTLHSAYQGSNHTPPDTSHLVWRVADKVQDEELQVFKANRDGNAKTKAVVDILATGEAKLKSSLLATFNKKISAMINGRAYEHEEDTIPQAELSIATEETDEGIYILGQVTDEASL